jgi:predicted PurR-regulated permease PerM
MLLNRVSYILTPLRSITNVLLLPMIISLFLYYALRPIVRKFENKKINKSIIIILTMLVFISALSAFIVFGGIAVKNEFTGAFFYDMDTVRNYFNNVDGKLGGMLSRFEFTQNLLEASREAIVKIGGSALGVFSSIGSTGTQVILVPFISFYFLKEDKKFAQWATKAVPVKYRKQTKDMFIQIDSVLSTYISGQLIVAMIIGVLMYIGYLIIGMPNALVMAFFSTITSIIPFIGPFLGIIPALLIALTINGAMIIKIIVVSVIVQQIEGNLITPNIIGNKLNVHPLAVILIVIISVTLFGILGAFVGIPLFVVLGIIVKNIYKIYTIMKKSNINK